jgi:hypothetical protein
MDQLLLSCMLLHCNLNVYFNGTNYFPWRRNVRTVALAGQSRNQRVD